MLLLKGLKNQFILETVTLRVTLKSPGSRANQQVHVIYSNLVVATNQQAMTNVPMRWCYCVLLDNE